MTAIGYMHEIDIRVTLGDTFGDAVAEGIASHEARNVSRRLIWLARFGQLNPNDVQFDAIAGSDLSLGAMHELIQLASRTFDDPEMIAWIDNLTPVEMIQNYPLLVQFSA